MSEPDTTVLMLPGLLCDADVWEPQIASLTGARCVVPDYRSADSITTAWRRSPSPRRPGP